MNVVTLFVLPQPEISQRQLPRAVAHLSSSLPARSYPTAMAERINCPLCLRPMVPREEPLCVGGKLDSLTAASPLPL